MKKYAQNLIKACIAVMVWYACLAALAAYRIKTAGVKPEFPYYNILMVGREPAEAVWGYFDGTHYLHLAEYGYDSTGPQAFFPVYPAITRALHNVSGLDYFESGKIISYIFLCLALSMLPSIFGKKSFWYAAILLLFPTSFFFGSLYTESLFLCLSLFFFICVKRQQFFVAACIAGIASATRLVGCFLAVALVVELLKGGLNKKWGLIQQGLYILFLVGISLSGLIGYMLFLKNKFDDPLMFLHVQTLFGAERSSDTLILLPQVMYRYIRMIMTVDPLSFLYQRVWLEVSICIGAVYLWIKQVKHVPRGWSVYTGASLLLPTLTGTLSSMPRYVLVLAPLLLPVPRTMFGRLTFLLISCIVLVYLFWHYVGGTFIA